MQYKKVIHRTYTKAVNIKHLQIMKVELIQDVIENVVKVDFFEGIVRIYYKDTPEATTRHLLVTEIRNIYSITK